MFQPGVILPQLLAEAHIELHVNWGRFATTAMLFLGLVVLAIYLESRSPQKKKKK